MGNRSRVADSQADECEDAELCRHQLASFHFDLLVVFQQCVEPLHKLWMDVQERLVEVLVEPLLLLVHHLRRVQPFQQLLMLTPFGQFQQVATVFLERAQIATAFVQIVGDVVFFHFVGFFQCLIGVFQLLVG